MLENPKLLTLEQAVAARAKLRAAGKSLVLTNGVFDLLHTGHLYYLTAEIEALRPDIYCKAGDYTLEKLDSGERGALQACGAKIEFMPFLPGFSTTALIARIKAAGEI